MGSTSYEIADGVTGRQEALTYVTTNVRGTILDHAYGRGEGHNAIHHGGWGNVLYVLADFDTAHGIEREVMIVLFSVYKYNGTRDFVVKVLSETSGTGNVDCPKRFLKQLHPTTDENKLAWRAGVERFHARRAAARALIGSTIVLARPDRFGEPVGQVDTVTVESLTAWRSPEHPRYRLKPHHYWWMRDYAVLDSASAERGD